MEKVRAHILKPLRLLLLSLLFYAGTTPLTAELLGGSLDISMGSFFGGMEEQIYEDDIRVNRMDWDENWVPYLSVSGEFTLQNAYINLGLITSIPADSGAVEDIDYGYEIEDSAAISSYGQHQAVVNKHLEVYPRIGYRFELKNWSIAPELGFLYRVRKWFAIDGYLQYPLIGTPWTEDTRKRPQSGTIISYQETVWFPAVSLSVGYKINERFDIRASGSWYPYIEAEILDNHVRSLTLFQDILKGGMGGLADLTLTYHPKRMQGLAFFLNTGWEGVFAGTGSSAIGSIGKDTDNGLWESADRAEIRSNMWWAALGLTIYPGQLWAR
jgi:outer membrane protease